MDLQSKKGKLKDFLLKTIRKNSAILWLPGTTFAAFFLYAIMAAAAVYFPSLTSNSVWSDITVFGGIIIPLFLPAIFLRFIKIRLGATATKVFTAICTISLIIWLFAEFAFFLGLISGRLKSEYLLSFIITACILLYFGIFVRISILFSLLMISDLKKRTVRIILFILSFLELALLAFYIFMGLQG